MTDAIFVMVDGRLVASFYGLNAFHRAIWCARSEIFGGRWTIVDEHDAILDKHRPGQCKIKLGPHVQCSEYIADDTWEETKEEGSWRSRPPLL